MFFLRGYNSQCLEEVPPRGREHKWEFMEQELLELLGHPVFGSLPKPNFSDFITGKTNETATLTGTFHTGDSPLTYKVHIAANGRVNVTAPQPKIQFEKKIRYAFANISFLFGPHHKDNYGVPSLWTFQNNMRLLFSGLNQDSKDEIARILCSLFGISAIDIARPEEGSGLLELNVIERSGLTLEIAYEGAAVQKVVATLILLSKLRENDSKQKIFIAEEPEAFIYPSLVEEFVQHIQRLCAEKQIQLIITSNAVNVIELFNRNGQRIILSSVSPELIPFDLQTLEFLKITAALVPSKPVLFFDGSTDKYFIQSYFPDWINKINFIYGGLTSTEFFVTNYAKQQKLRVAYLQDREFCHPDLLEVKRNLDSQKGGSAAVFYWELPCIESFLILNWFLTTDKEKARTVASAYIKSVKRSTDYILGVTQEIQTMLDDNTDDGKYDALEHTKCWDQAKQELQKENPDWKIIVMVIHGHTFMEEHFGTRNTNEVVSRYPFKFLHQQVQDLVGITKQAIDVKFFLETQPSSSSLTTATATTLTTATTSTTATALTITLTTAITSNIF